MNRTSDSAVAVQLWSLESDIILIVLYVAVSVASLFCNMLALYLIVSKRVRRSTSNLLLANLSISDITASLSMYPYIFFESTIMEFSDLKTDTMCSFTVGLTPFWICTTVNLLTLACMAFYRYHNLRNILRPSKQVGTQEAKRIIVFMWLFALVLLVPNFFSFQFDKSVQICRRRWPNQFNGFVYSLFTFCLGMFLPLVLMMHCFIFMVLMYRKGIKSDATAIRRQWQSRRRINKLLGLFILFFFICWGPFFVYWLLSRVTTVFSIGIAGDFERLRAVRVIALIASFNFLSDPILYGFVSSDFRNALMAQFSRNNDVSPSMTYQSN